MKSEAHYDDEQDQSMEGFYKKNQKISVDDIIF